MRLLLTAVTAVAALSLAACAHTAKQAEVSEAPAPKATPPAPAPAPVAEAVTACASDTDCADGSLCLRKQCVAITADLAECSGMRVHFEFNVATIRAEDTPGLQRMARCLRASSALHVTIEGNADERGTEEYNMLLGSKRASGVEAYLQTLGVSRAQLDTISYGYERPLCTEKNEACWAKNRRVAVKPEPKK
ncbi:MAG: OmpA family protein [Myxococcus sp.]|nr:OmpA family protein [Myxococcus sp.]